jgi:predicted nucleic acid-binding protein
MKVIDTSVAIPAIVSWHEASVVARDAASNSLIPAHARLETYSVLTRMPPPHRLSPALVAELLESWFPPERTLVASDDLSLTIVDRCQQAGIAGGAVYDALVGSTAHEVGSEILTRDTRAARTYERLGIAFRLT